MNHKTKKWTIGLGWGIRARVQSRLSLEAHRLGVKLEPWRFCRMTELVAIVDVVVSGDPEKVGEFEAYMKRMGYV